MRQPLIEIGLAPDSFVGARECVMCFVPEMNCDCAFFPRKCAYAEFSSKLCGLKATNSKMPAAKHLARVECL